MDGSFLERFQAEAGDALAAIFDHSRDCIKLLSLTGELEYVSASARNALGLADSSQAIGKSWPAFWPPSERARIDAAIATAASGESARFAGRTMDDTGGVRHWEVTVSPVRGSGGVITHLLAVSSEVTSRIEAERLEMERRDTADRDAAHAETMTRELRHRLKNQLAVVGAVAKLLSRHTSDARELARKLEDKLIALAHAQDLLTLNRDNPIDARGAISQVLAASGAGERVEIGDIPPVALPDESVQQIALILGELHTNALEHGALRDDGGRVALWGRLQDGYLTLRWEEDCGASVTPVEAGSGGFQLIRRLGTAGRLTPAIAWLPNGIVVEFHVRAATIKSA